MYIIKHTHDNLFLDSLSFSWKRYNDCDHIDLFREIKSLNKYVKERQIGLAEAFEVVRILSTDPNKPFNDIDLYTVCTIDIKNGTTLIRDMKFYQNNSGRLDGFRTIYSDRIYLTF
jgi:hypothetical protein